MLMSINRKRKGFSLVEILVFISIISIFFVSAASITTMAMRQVDINMNKLRATHYAEELANLARSEKELNWDQFVSYGNNTYCLNASGNDINWASTSSTSCPCFSNSFFKCTIHLTQDTSSLNNPVVAAVKVDWTDRGSSYEVPLQTIFTLWEE